VFAHQAANFLRIHDQPLVAQCGTYAPVAVAFKLITNRRNCGDDLGLPGGDAGCVVEGRARDPHQPASFGDGQSSGPVMTDIVAPLGRRALFNAPQHEIDTLTAEGEAIMAEHGEEPEDDEITERLWRIQERIANLAEGEELWPEATKASTGAVIGIGLIRPEDKAAIRKAERTKQMPRLAAKARPPLRSLPR
jgi:hypothetical protein